MFDSNWTYADASKNEALKNAFDDLVSQGDKHLHYVYGRDLFKDLGPLVNPTVGGVHSSDLGQYEIADYYVGALPNILGWVSAIITRKIVQ